MADKNEEGKQQKLEQLYGMAMSSGNLPAPKRSLFSVKCPKCGGKLKKDTVKELIVGVDGGDAFVLKVLSEASVPVGAYYLTIERFTCEAGDYDYARRMVEEVSEGA
jgi:hypothetical protein